MSHWSSFRSTIQLFLFSCYKILVVYLCVIIICAAFISSALFQTVQSERDDHSVRSLLFTATVDPNLTLQFVLELKPRKMIHIRLDYYLHFYLLHLDIGGNTVNIKYQTNICTGTCTPRTLCTHSGFIHSSWCPFMINKVKQAM